MQSEIGISAFAKLNLALAVAPPRPATAPDRRGDPKAGWHEISSLFACIDLHDDLVLRVAGETLFEIRWAADAPRSSPIDWPIEKDLAFRAHGLVQAHVGRALPVHATLFKRIPVGGGLGGGSSDAAAMLRGLNALFDLGLARGEMLELADRLGSDVAFFLDDEGSAMAGKATAANLGQAPRPALVEGFGGRIIRRERFRCGVLLIVPPVACPTPRVYAAFDRSIASNPEFRFRDNEVRRLAAVPGIPTTEALFNDLAEPACAVAPELKEIRAVVGRFVRPVHVTGSGSTLFAIPAPGEPVVNDLAKALGDRATLLRAKFV